MNVRFAAPATNPAVSPQAARPACRSGPRLSSARPARVPRRAISRTFSPGRSAGCRSPGSVSNRVFPRSSRRSCRCRRARSRASAGPMVRIGPRPISRVALWRMSRSAQEAAPFRPIRGPEPALCRAWKRNGVRGGIRTHGPRIHPTSAFAAGPGTPGPFVVWTVPSPWAPAAMAEAGRCRPSSLYTFPGRGRGLARDRQGRSRPQLSPTLSGSVAPFPIATPSWQQGILCSILLSYADARHRLAAATGHI